MGSHCAGKIEVRIDGQYDYVDHATRSRRVMTLDQSAVHSLPVAKLKHVRRRRRGNLFKACSERPEDPEARAVVAAAEAMAEACAHEPDMLDKDWQGPRGQGTLQLLLAGGSGDPCETLQTLAKGVKRLAQAEPTLLRAPVPTRIFGDLHGQFRDLLLWLQDFGFPHQHGPAYVFNGDWVDRGAHQLETVGLVFALKVAYPDKVFLVRGNHEFRDQNEHMGAVGFCAACCALDGGEEVYEAFQDAFDHLPLGCLVGGKVLVVHGGLGDGQWDLEDLENVPRPVTPETVGQQRHVYNVLWSDPVPETRQRAFGVHGSPRDGHRRLVLDFGPDVTEEFCERNDIEAVVRSHQEKVGGCGYEVMHGNRLVRVFSARDYEGHRNDGAMLKLRWSRGSKLVIRPQLLRSLTKRRDPALAEGELADPPAAETMESIFLGPCSNACMAGADDGAELLGDEPADGSAEVAQVTPRTLSSREQRAARPG